MKRLLYGLFITAMLFSLISCGTEVGSESKMDSDNEVSVTDQTEETSEMQKADETGMQGGEKTLEKGVFNFEKKRSC